VVSDGHPSVQKLLQPPSARVAGLSLLLLRSIPRWLSMKFGVFERLPWWNRTMEARSKAPSTREVKSMAAEMKVLEAAKLLPGVVSVHHAIRIPNPQLGLGSGEVDVVVVTSQACLLIEVKNFLGQISLEDGDIVQYKGSKPRREDKEILPLVHQKAQYLRRWGASLFNNAALEVVPMVVLPNPNAELDQAVLDHAHVATLKTLDAKVSYLLQNHPLLEQKEIANVQEMMSMFGTWDRVSNEAGLALNGDLIDIDLPAGWNRKDLASVEVRVVGGKWKTLFRGPKIAVTMMGRDGASTTSIVQPDLAVRHSQPWGKSGLDGRGLYPIEHFSTIAFGHQNEVVSDAKGLRVQKIASQHFERLSPLPEMVESDHESVRKDLAKRFSVGTITNGAVVRHLFDKKGAIYGILVSLVERELNCLLPSRVVRTIHPDLFDVFYSVGKVIEVRITENQGPGKIYAELY
jgi:hypothetical protein